MSAIDDLRGLVEHLLDEGLSTTARQLEQFIDDYTTLAADHTALADGVMPLIVANTRTDRKLRRIDAAIRKIHYADPASPYTGGSCIRDGEYWPCSTIQELDRE